MIKENDIFHKYMSMTLVELRKHDTFITGTEYTIFMRVLALKEESRIHAGMKPRYKEVYRNTNRQQLEQTALNLNSNRMIQSNPVIFISFYEVCKEKNIAILPINTGYFKLKY